MNIHSIEGRVKRRGRVKGRRRKKGEGLGKEEKEKRHYRHEPMTL